MTSPEEFASAYDFTLPEELVAQHPSPQRDGSRLMVVGHPTEHRTFRDLPEYLREGDVLVLNETRVLAARVFGTRPPGNGRVELLLLHPAHAMAYGPDALRWVALVRPARRVKHGDRIEFGDGEVAHVVAELDDGARELAFEIDGPMDAFLERRGRLPLPPYIHNDSDEAQTRYQTVFARMPGSVAAPTASLHFTEELLARIAARGIRIARLTLDVGLGTFRPMKHERLVDHTMHAETYRIARETIDAIDTARARGSRVIAAGTTVMRALEGNAAEHGTLVAGPGETSIFIRPGFTFRVVDALITNFHLPKSTLLVLVSAFAGRTTVLDAYDLAVTQRYRFFSFGDAMLLARGGASQPSVAEPSL